MKIGVQFEVQDGVGWNRWRELAARVDELGYESLWRSDHLFSVVGDLTKTGIETWTSLTYLATATSRIRFGPLVSPMTFRHPSLLALQAAAVDELSGGRLEVGVGAGWEPREHESFGVPFPSTPERFERLDEGLTVMKLLWTEPEPEFEGRFYSLHGARLHPKPLQRPHPPIVVGGTGEKRSLRIVAKHADEWNAHGVTVDVYRAKRAVLDRYCAEFGRDPAAVRHSVTAPCAIGMSENTIRDRIDAQSRLLPLRTPAFFPEGKPQTIDALRARGWIVGRPEEIVDQIRTLAEAGVDRVMLELIDAYDDESLELIAREVLPNVA